MAPKHLGEAVRPARGHPEGPGPGVLPHDPAWTGLRLHARPGGRLANFSISYSEPGDGLWGAATDTAGLVFNGMVGELSRLEADLATGGLYASRDRGRVVDFSVPVFQDTITLHIVRQNGNIINWIVYMVKGTKK